MHRPIHALRCEEKGAAVVEYGVICVAAVTVLGTEVSSTFSVIASQLSAL
jgi:Flp pilus assembly pilin Flp